jgi:hypothetical protein
MRDLEKLFQAHQYTTGAFGVVANICAVVVALTVAIMSQRARAETDWAAQIPWAQGRGERYQCQMEPLYTTDVWSWYCLRDCPKAHKGEGSSRFAVAHRGFGRPFS